LTSATARRTSPRALEPRAHSPFVDPVPPHADARFVEPRLVVEVAFSEWTPDGRLRHPVFLGVRDDVDPDAVRREP
jgi:bifunctional non-homologous end joining protein LigD